MVLDTDTARAAFESSCDFTVGLEEEFALLDSELTLIPAFDDMRAAAESDPVLAESISGELIESEIEIRSGRGADLAAAMAAQREPAQPKAERREQRQARAEAAPIPPRSGVERPGEGKPKREKPSPEKKKFQRPRRGENARPSFDERDAPTRFASRTTLPRRRGRNKRPR